MSYITMSIYLEAVLRGLVVVVSRFYRLVSQ